VIGQDRLGQAAGGGAGVGQQVMAGRGQDRQGRAGVVGVGFVGDQAALDQCKMGGKVMARARDRKALVARFIEEVWNRGDVGAAADYLAPRYTVRHDPGDPWDGRELDLAQYGERLRAALAPCPDQRFELLAVVADDAADRVVSTWSWSGTHTGELAGFAPTGQRLQMTGATVYFFDEADRITGHWQVIDRLGVFQQLRRNGG
jgi:predicted ester cyclase